MIDLLLILLVLALVFLLGMWCEDRWCFSIYRVDNAWHRFRGRWER